MTKFECIEVVSGLLEKSIMNFAISSKQQNQELTSLQSGTQLKETNLMGISITPFLEADQIEGNTVELRLGSDFKLSILVQSPVNETDSDNDYEFSIAKYFLTKNREMDDKFTLYPIQVVLATTLEYVTLPDNRCGELTLHDCHPKLEISFASIIDPGFRGCIPLQLKNFGDEPIDLVVGGSMMQLELKNPDETSKSSGFKLDQSALFKPKLSRIGANKEFKFQNSQRSQDDVG